MKRIRTGSQQGTVRPFSPSMSAESDAEHISDALDSIARSLAAIDHNLETLTTQMMSIAHALPQLTKSR
jgi:hypothetical protein